MKNSHFHKKVSSEMQEMSESIKSFHIGELLLWFSVQFL